MELPNCLAPAIVLLIACYTLLFLGYASSSSESLEGCPLIAPLSPSIRSVDSSPVTSQVAAKLDTIVSSFIANNSIPFYAVSVVHADQTVYTSGLATSPFMIGSVTKTFTALGALVLRERGLLSLDDPVKKFLPNFTVINPYEPHDITLRELMGHVSGLPRELCAAQCPVEDADVLKSIAQMQLVRPAWSREPSYSNLGFALLGHSWEKATSPSKAWDEFVVEDILKPLGMNSTGVDVTNVTLVTNLSAIIMLRMLLKNSTENSFWLGIDADCFSFFVTLSGYISTTDPNYPGTDYLDEIEFDFANKTLLWRAVGVVCLKK